MRIAPNPKNDKGEMDVQVPVQINFPIPQVGQSDDGVESITFGLGQVRLNLQLQVKCACSKAGN